MKILLAYLSVYNHSYIHSLTVNLIKAHGTSIERQRIIQYNNNNNNNNVTVQIKWFQM